MLPVSYDLKNKEPHFKGNPAINLASYLDERVLLGKAVLDIVAFDTPQIIMANNPQERREKFNKVSFSFALGYLSPLVTLPLTNRLGMKHIAKLTKSFKSKDASLIRISNKYLVNAEETRKGVEKLSKDLKTDYSSILKTVGGDYEKLRKKLINAKNAVLSFDLFFTTASIGSIGFFNNWQTKKKTKQDGYSAEFNMADKNIVEKRAESFKKKEPLRKAIWLTMLAALTAFPLLLKKGLTSQNASSFNNYIKKISPKFDYIDGIFISRLPFFMSAVGFYSGLILASRNKTELKDTTIRNSVSAAGYFGGDILIGSVLGRLSDKFLKTNLMKTDIEKSLLNKLIPPTKPLRELEGKNKAIGAALYWLNLAMLSASLGFGVPYLINKMIKNDVKQSIDEHTATRKLVSIEDFGKKAAK
ncbi:hypothetical protein J6E39_06170 [bacterium]|nr:hypothetical protein [bacterium]